MINLYNTYINCDPDPTNQTTIRNVIRHIEYITDLIGVDYVGMGSDYDGVTKVPEGDAIRFLFLHCRDSFFRFIRL